MRVLILLLMIVLLYSKNFTDALKRVVKIDKSDKIVAVGPGALRMVVYLGAKDRVVGIEARESKFIYARPYILANKELLKLPKIGMGGANIDINLEAILKLKPDLIVGVMPKERANILQEKLNIPVFVVTYGELGNFNNEFFNSLTKLSKVLNKENRAKEIIDFIKNLDIKKVKCTKKVYVGGIAYKGLHGLTSTIGEFPPFKLVGIKNIVDSKTQIFINKEFLFNIDPDIIFIDESSLKLINFNEYKDLKAFKNHQVYGILPFNNYNTNIEVAILDAYYIQNICEGGVEIEKRAKEVFEFFVSKDIYQEMKQYFGGFRKLY